MPLPKAKSLDDAGTGNETDDIYVLARLLIEPSADIVGISSVLILHSFTISPR